MEGVGWRVSGGGGMEDESLDVSFKQQDVLIPNDNNFRYHCHGG